MAFTYNKKCFKVGGVMDKWPSGTMCRQFKGKHISCEQNFCPSRKIYYEFFDSESGQRLRTFTEEQIKDVVKLMKHIEDHKEELIPEEFR